MASTASQRWLVLALGSVLMFGNYYAYDIPASLSTGFASHFGFEPAELQYNLNAYYALYSLPNTILPFWGGYLVDKYGSGRMISILGMIVCLGQGCVALAVQWKVGWSVWIGRLIFGIGAESLSVAQTRMTTKWFRGKELALALGVNLSVARLGTVFNDLLTPHLAYSISVPFAVWMGLFACLLSFACGLGLLRIDRKAALVSQVDLRSGSDKLTTTVIKTYPKAFWMLCCILCALYATVIPFNTIHAGFLQRKWYPKDPERAAQLTAIPDTLSAILTPLMGLYSDIYGHRVKTIITCGLLMAAIHFYLGMVSNVGTSPVPALVLLGGTYAMLLTFWPCVAIVVGEEGSATAFGLATSFLNISLTVFPIVVAQLIVMDPSYVLTELFFVTCSILGSAIAVLLFWHDRKYTGGVLERPEKDAEVPVRGEGPGAYVLVERGGGSHSVDKLSDDDFDDWEPFEQNLEIERI
ncbi:major facilitator superfamily domain-containing protein [Phlyctochytrium arcticum]|nr:major facilitator superfamily domain-containing protein [Phlyctochytrium arcticum]